MNRPLVVLTLVAALACQQAKGNAFDRAAEAAGRAKFKEAARLYTEAAETDPDPVRRAKAAIRLANIEWRIFEKHEDARKRLQRVIAGPHEAFDAQIELARVAFDAKKLTAAKAEARNAMKIAGTRRERSRAIGAFARAVLEAPPYDAAEIRETIASLKSVIAEQGPFTETARLLLKAALIAGDGATAMEAVDGYYHVSKFSKPPNAIAAAHASLAHVLPSWKGTDPERPALVEALGGIRFFEEAALVSRGPATDVVAYAKMLERVDELVTRYYREMANDDEDDDDLKDGIDRKLRALWPVISKAKYNRKQAEAELAKRFGTFFNVGETGNFIDTHFGHIVGDRTLPIEQYGRKASMRFVELDTMVSNGFNTFLSDGQSNDGGWATETEIYQVRPAYANGPLRDWQRVFDDEVRAKEDKEMAEETARDRERAKTQAIGQFPGLAKRLKKQYLERVASELQAQGLTGEALREAFLARVEKEEFQYSILLHEGRHSIDKLSKERFATWELEYRGKLSQVALADAPRPALQSVVDYTIGGSSPHGKANEKFVKGLVGWMEANRGAIQGLDPSLPLLPQADKLSDEQIRAAVRSLDPLAR